MNTVETITTSLEATGAFLVLVAVAREAVKRPWIKASWSFSIAILPPEKRMQEPDGTVPTIAAAPAVVEPPAAAAVPAGANGAAS